MGGSRDIPIQTVSQANQNDWPKETWNKYPIKVIQTAMRVQLWLSLFLSTPVAYCTFSPLINTLLASLLSVFVEILFCKAEGPGPLSLTTGQVARNLGLNHGPTSISGPEPKPCFKPLQIKATWDQVYSRLKGKQVNMSHVYSVFISPSHFITTTPSMLAYVVPISQMKTRGPEKLLKTGTCLP